MDSIVPSQDEWSGNKGKVMQCWWVEQQCTREEQSLFVSLITFSPRTVGVAVMTGQHNGFASNRQSQPGRSSSSPAMPLSIGKPWMAFCTGGVTSMKVEGHSHSPGGRCRLVFGITFPMTPLLFTPDAGLRGTPWPLSRNARVCTPRTMCRPGHAKLDGTATDETDGSEYLNHRPLEKSGF